MIEKIICAAVRRKEKNRAYKETQLGEQFHLLVYSLPRPSRHPHILYSMSGNIHNVEQGFLTSYGRFVEREEAREIAEASGQLLPTAIKNSRLFSEDVW